MLDFLRQRGASFFADIVRGTTLAFAASRLGLGEHMILGRGEEAAGGRLRDRNLAGAMEAVVGAVYRANGYRSARAALLNGDLAGARARLASFVDDDGGRHAVRAQYLAAVLDVAEGKLERARDAFAEIAALPPDANRSDSPAMAPHGLYPGAGDDNWDFESANVPRILNSTVAAIFGPDHYNLTAPIQILFRGMGKRSGASRVY